MAESPDRKSIIDSIVSEFVVAIQNGEPISVQSLIDKHPEYESEIRSRLLPAETGPASPPTDASPAIDAPTSPATAPHPPADQSDAIVLEIEDRNEETPRQPPSDQTTAWHGSSNANPDSSADSKLGSQSDPHAETAAPGPRQGQATLLPAGTVIGDYRLIRLLGRGGMGEVYEVAHVESAQQFALKILSSRLPRNDENVQRFLNEASLAANLSNPHTTFVYEAGQASGKFFIVMELMPGDTLKDYVEKHGPLPTNQAVDFILDVLEGLHAAHSKGVIHRDLKPSNCFLDDDDQVKVGDFGLAKSLVQSADLTQTGTFLGTPQFAAPEQIRRGDVDQRTDIFAAGATLYYLLAGRAPFDGDPAAVIAQIVADKPPSLRDLLPDVPLAVSRIVDRTLSKNPEKRFADVEQLHRALAPFGSESSSIADIGRRAAAFCLDLFAVAIGKGVVFLLGVFVLFVLDVVDFKYLDNVRDAVKSPWMLAFVAVPYFTLSEWIWGTTLGKHKFGLRVVNSTGDPPPFRWAFVRALIFPGLLWNSVDVFRGITEESELILNFCARFIQDEVLREWLVPRTYHVFQLVAAALCFVTVRRAYGFRGIHEWLSGTQVVRTTQVRDTSAEYVRLVSSCVRDMSNLPARVGPFGVTARVSQDEDVEVFAGTDQSLQRPVWIYRTDQPEFDLPPLRSQLSRRSRPRWLSGGKSEQGGRWQAVEPVDGCSVSTLLDVDGTMSWEFGRNVVPDLVREVFLGKADQTMPERLSRDQLWLDVDGDLKILDFPAATPVPLDANDGGRSISKSSISFGNEVAPTVDTWRVVTDVAKRCLADHSTPGCALDALRDLPDTLPADASQQKQIVDRLTEAARQPYRMRWDDRLGMLAISATLENLLVNTWCVLVSVAVCLIFKHKLAISLLVAIPLGMLLPIVLAYVCDGGLAIRLTGREVRKLAGGVASRGRSVYRNVLAWCAPVIVFTVFDVCLFSLSTLKQADETLQRSDAEPLLLFIVVVFLPVVLISVLWLVGFIWSIISPRRGLHDVVAGTYLTCK